MRRRMRPGSAPGLAVVLGLAGIGVALAVLVPLRGDLTLATPALVLVLPVVAAGLVGGVRAAALVAVASAAAFNVAFLRPYGTFSIADVEEIVALAVFLLVAIAVGVLVTLEADRRRAAETRTAELVALNDRLEAVSAERERLAADAARLAVLQRVDDQRAALLRSVSHDLRTPLAAIRAISSDLRDGAVYDEVVQRELLGTVCDEAERLDRLVGDLLSMSRIEAGDLRPDRQAVDVEELVRTTARRLRRLFVDRDLRLDVDAALPLVDADYSQLDQVFTNLIENAARHAPPASTVVVRAAADDGHIDVRVTDAGPGVPVGERDRIFQPFSRGPGGGTSGLGLAICRAIVDAHGGTVSVDDEPGGGATFLVRLPVRDG